MRTSYPAKLLLFGEYTVLKGSRALSLPLPDFSGRWAPRTADTPSDPPVLKDWPDYLRREAPFLDTEALLEFLQDHFFQTNIPIGYGLGSSGALCAAVYDRFAREKSTALPQLQAELGGMEGFFHGSSSGLDPLTAYLDHPVLVTPEGCRRTDYDREKPLHGRIFLFDTGRSRQTAPLVAYFLERCAEPAFEQVCREELAEAANRGIDAFLQRDSQALYAAWRQISSLQRLHFHRMIPEELRKIWQQGIAEQQFFLKLCGAGGGGFLLGWLPPQGKLPDLFSPEQLLFPRI